jgi:hypothetical protein
MQLHIENNLQEDVEFQSELQLALDVLIDDMKMLKLSFNLI